MLLINNAHQFGLSDLHQLRGHHDEVSGNFKIELMQKMEVIEELLRDLGYRNIVNIQLVPFDKK